MRYLFVLLSVLLLSAGAYSQNATLTKGETIEYLNKKLKELVGYKIKETNATILESYLVADDKGIKIFQRTSKGDAAYPREVTYVFNPLHIRSISLDQSTKNLPLREVNIWLKGEVAQHTRYFHDGYGKDASLTRENSALVSSVYWLVSDVQHFERVKKAFLHLQALLKAEEDPFDQ